MNDEKYTSFGAWIRKRRITQHRSLRQLAELLAISPSYLSDIERDRRLPAEDVLLALGRLLEVDAEEVFARAGRLGHQAEWWLFTSPEAIRLVRMLAQNEASEDTCRGLSGRVVRLWAQRKERSHERSL